MNMSAILLPILLALLEYWYLWVIALFILFIKTPFLKDGLVKKS